MPRRKVFFARTSTMLTLAAATVSASLAPPAAAAPAPARSQPANQPPPTLLAPASEPQTIPEPVVAGAQVLPLDTILKHAEENAMPVRTARTRLELGDA